jgi:hypothetical protein
VAHGSQLVLRVFDAEGGDLEVAGLARLLSRELLATEVADVRTAVDGAAATNVKAAQTLAYGVLLVSLVQASGALRSLVDAVASWLRRQPTSVEVDFDGQRISGNLTREQRDALVRALLARVEPENSAEPSGQE